MMKQTLIIIILASFFAGCVSIQVKKESHAWSEGNTLHLDVEMVSVPDNDLQRVCLRLTAINTGTNSLMLDKEMLAGFSLRFKTDLSEQYFRSDEQDQNKKGLAQSS